ncbi:MAG: amino acid adenylation domain-containing protein, partial [Longimicrobiaceae bacterium]
MGSPIAGRTRAETEGLIGFFVNMLALRADLDGDPTWRELLGRTRETALGAYARQELPFERLVEELGAERSLTHSPVFQVTFALNRAAAAAEGLRLGEVEQAPFGAGAGAAKFELELALADTGDGLAGELIYRTALFEAATAGRMAGHLEALLQSMADDPGRRPAEVSLLSGAERTQVLEGWNGPDVEIPQGSVYDLFAEQAARTPGAVAVVSRDEALTYAGLERRAGRLAHVLRRHGAGPERVVGIFMEHSADVVAALLGTFRAGGCCLLLDPEHPRARIASLLEDAGVELVLAQAHLRGRLPSGANLRVVEPDGEGTDGSEALPPLPCIAPESAAYLVYTSGSTGRPKGVLVSHGAAAAHLREVGRTYGLSPADRVLVFAAQSFDPFLEQALAPLLAGASVALRDPVVWTPAEFAEQVGSRGVTVANVPPMYWGQLVSERATVAALKQALRLMIVGGEALAPPTVRAWEEGGEGAARLLNAYGPTEAVVTATVYEATGGGTWGGSVPIGRAVAGRKTYVLDPRGEPVPVGVPGELYLGGRVLARGYLGLAEQTASRFVPDALGGESGARLYATGDRARWLASGELEYLGRLDAQVKVRGVRIEPGEVEAALRRHPAVRDAAVAVREDRPGQRMLVGYHVSGREQPPAAAELRAVLRAQLPPHPVPGAFVAMDRLPLTPSGKLDRRALPAPEPETAAYVAPRTAAEEVLAGIWADVLGVDRVGVEAGFFDLGGHSLLATQVVSRARHAFGVEVPLRTLFEAPTVAELAGRIEALRGTVAPPAPPIERVSRDEALPLSFAQQRLWVVDRLEPGSAAYNMPAALRLRGALDSAALRASLDTLVARHETLRTTFAEEGGVPVQLIHPAAPVALRELDLRHLPGAEREAEAERLASAEALTPFDLARGPLLRSTLLRVDEAEHVVLFTLHHVVSDGWSMQVLTREVSALYSAFSRGEEPRLAELPVQYADFAVWQRAWLAGEVLGELIGYWKERLAGAPPLLEIPTDHPRAPGQSPLAQSRRFTLPAEVTRGLRTLSREKGATLFMTLLAGWQALLWRYAGQEDVVVGTPIAGRTRRETEGLIGFFVNMLALRGDLSGDPTWTELLGRTRETALGAYEHQELPFERLVEELEVERTLAHAPVFQVTFELERAAAHEGLALGELALEPLGAAEGAARFDLDLALQDTGESLAGTLTCRAALFEAATIERMAGHLEAVLEALSAGSERRVSEVSLLRAAEREQVVEAWNRTARPWPRGVCIHELFEAQVALRPDAAALVWGDVELTYAQLDARANRLARHLGGLGVGPESRVGVLLERGVELI